mgnify:CR=1 FL=1
MKPLGARPKNALQSEKHRVENHTFEVERKAMGMSIVAASRKPATVKALREATSEKPRLARAETIIGLQDLAARLVKCGIIKWM